MNEIQIFNNPEFNSVRALNIDGEPWFVGKDIAASLGYSNPSKAVMMHVDAEDKFKMMLRADSQNGNVVTETTMINESGMYALIFGSKLPSAKKFKRWVTSEVLPALRKTGTYSMKPPKANSLKDVINYANLIRDVFKERGASPEEISKAIDEGCSQYGVKFPEYFKDESKLTMKDVFDMVDYVFDHPKIGNRKPTYEDFVMEHTTLTRRRLK